MGFEEPLKKLIAGFVAFYIGCAMIGRADIPWRFLTHFRATVISQSQGDWGCPSVFDKNSCFEYKPSRHK